MTTDSVPDGEPLPAEVAGRLRTWWRAHFRLGVALLIAGFVASWVIGWGNLSLYQNRFQLFGDRPDEWSWLTVDPWMYVRQPVVYWLFGGLPAAVLAFLLVAGAGRSRRVTLLGLTIGAFLPVPAAWWLNLWAGPWYLAGLAAVLSGVIGTASFIAAAAVVRAIPMGVDSRVRRAAGGSESPADQW